MTLNDDLAFMGGLLEKMRVQLFHLQHIHIDNLAREESKWLVEQVKQLSVDVSHLQRTVEAQKVILESTIKPMEVQPPLRTSGDILTSMRKFNGKESENDKIDFFEHNS